MCVTPLRACKFPSCVIPSRYLLGSGNLIQAKGLWWVEGGGYPEQGGMREPLIGQGVVALRATDSKGVPANPAHGRILPYTRDNIFNYMEYLRNQMG